MRGDGDAWNLEVDLPAFVAADPATGTIPTGYLIQNIAQATLKRHAVRGTWVAVGVVKGEV
jgi:hypothetical protein